MLEGAVRYSVARMNAWLEESEHESATRTVGG